VSSAANIVCLMFLMKINHTCFFHIFSKISGNGFYDRQVEVFGKEMADHD